MIPLRDNNPTSSFPVITYALIGINVVVFGWMLMMGEAETEMLISQYALIPTQVVEGNRLITLVTSMFLHGGFGHIIGNMLFLNIFGDNLEDRMGHVKYLIFYLLSGLGATAAQIWSDSSSQIPVLGASGAIAGLMGGYLRLFPHHRIDVLVPIGLVANTASVPAIFMLGYWFVAQLFSGVGSLGLTGGGIAYLAHVGGFVTGLLLVGVFTRGNSKRLQTN